MRAQGLKGLLVLTKMGSSKGCYPFSERNPGRRSARERARFRTEMERSIRKKSQGKTKFTSTVRTLRALGGESITARKGGRDNRRGHCSLLRKIEAFEFVAGGYQLHHIKKNRGNSGKKMDIEHPESHL